jgi:hypothetical protein
MILLYVWALLTAPTDRMVCSMWLSHPPTSENMTAAGCDWSPEIATDYIWRAIDWRTGQVICERPAAELPRITCDLWPIDHYLLRVYEPNYREQLCMLTIDHQGLPTVGDIATKCPSEAQKSMDANWEWVSTGHLDPPQPVIPACVLPQVENTVSISTANDYQFLRGRLVWWGIHIGPYEWQNRWDEQIRGAADEAGVPAMLLKRLIGAESQFWPLWTGDNGEAGWMQVTWDGADTALRYDQMLYDKYCSRAIFPGRCAIGYDLLDDWEQSRVQTQLIDALQVYGTPLEAANMAAADLPIYAHILRAFACYSKNLYPNTNDLWTTTAIVYNTGQACIQPNGTVCRQGKKYLEVMK